VVKLGVRFLQQALLKLLLPQQQHGTAEKNLRGLNLITQLGTDSEGPTLRLNLWRSIEEEKEKGDFFFFYGPPRVPRCRRSLGKVRPLR
jgi:hypothetical protein